MATDTRIKELLNSIQEAFDGNPWYGISVMEKLNSIDWYSANAVPRDGKKSVAQLLGHMINWRVFVLKKLQGATDFDIEMNSESDWPQIEIKNEEDWNQLRTELQQTQLELVRLLANFQDNWLDTTVPGKDYDFRHLVDGICQHDIYHLGQIGLIQGMSKTD